jgi:Ca2+/H+ antiporter
MLKFACSGRFQPSRSVLAAYGLAFVLLTWPTLWLVRYAITGQTLGD